MGANMNLGGFHQFLKKGSLIIIECDGSEHRFGEGSPSATWQIRAPHTFAKILRNPQRNLGETYIAGEWDVTEGSLHDLLTILRINLETELSNKILFKPAQALLSSWNHLAASKRNVQHHYDLDEPLFRACLDHDMNYSSAFFRDRDMSLEVAQKAKCSLIANKLCLQPGQKVLDVGCGWGGLVMYLAENYDVEVTGVILSGEQSRVAKQEAERRGLSDRVHFLVEDYREHHRPYDRLVSVGMFEHVGRRYQKTFFNKVAELITEDGIALLHTIASLRPPAPLNPWISRYIFPGGYIPSLSDIAPAIEHSGLITTDLEVLREHYALTLKEWNRRFQAQRDDFVASKGERFCRMWEFYLVCSQTAFEVGILVVHQWQLAKQQLAVPVTRDYLYPPDVLKECATSPKQTLQRVE